MTELLPQTPHPENNPSDFETWLSKEMATLQASERERYALKAIDPNRLSDTPGDYLQTVTGFFRAFSHMREITQALPNITPDHVDAARVQITARGEEAFKQFPKHHAELFTQLQSQSMPRRTTPAQERAYYQGALLAVGVVEAAVTKQKNPVKRRAMNLPAA